MPMTLVIITGEIDLSVASIAGLTSALMGVLWQAGLDIADRAASSRWLVGVVAGAFNGFLIAVVGLPSLAVTIGTLALFRGLALVVIGDNAVANFPPELTAFFTSKIGGTGIPTVMIGVLVVMVFFGVLLHFTPFGRGLYALGYSKEAATLRRHQGGAHASSGCTSRPASSPPSPACSGRSGTRAPAATTRPASSSP